MLPTKLLFSFILISTFSQKSEAQQEKLNYLHDLVKTEIKKATKYHLRTDNSDFFINVDKRKAASDFGKFDFIIVGGGSAGSVVANRLSEIHNWKILLLEAGGDNDELTDIPYFLGLSSLSDRNWGYLTTPQKNGCFGAKNNQCLYIRGKILGGTGTVNALLYSRGIKVDFDKWARQGNPSWSWDGVLPYYKKLENFSHPSSNPALRGHHGPLNINYVRPMHPLFKAFVRANEEVGIPYTLDYNTETNIGVSEIQRNIKHGRRVSGATNYVKPVMFRKNLNVTLKAYVTKLLINERTKTVYGVEFVRNSKRYKATATKEVIVSGGAVNSPQLLMLSGIGPKKDLAKHKIKLVKNLPVGKFMKDHPSLTFLYLQSNWTAPHITVKQLLQEYLNGKGLLTDSYSTNSILYYNTLNSSSKNPNLEIVFVPPQPIKRSFPDPRNDRAELHDFRKNINQSTNWEFHVFCIHPRSSGELSLKSGSPKDFPLIDTKMFDNKADIDDIYRGVQIVLKYMNTSVGKFYNLTLQMNIPSCSKKKYNSKAWWYCMIQHIAIPDYHITSTCKMGTAKDPLAVVDNRLKVYGIKNLRVVDVSIAPDTVSCHTNALAFMIGEKGSDMIKEDHLRKPLK